MYDVSTELSKFYRTEVVLPASDQNELRKKRKLNIKRLKDGLLEYNEEKRTDYKISENRIQGSMSMHTAVQNDKNDYDIDVAIVFEKDNLGDLGPLAAKNMVADAFSRKASQFNASPEVKTGCVRIKYADGYHVDFAIYRRYKENIDDDEYVYEFAGATWMKRDIRAVDEWFSDCITNQGDDLRKVVRLCKMFCKSRDSWKNMPSGLVQTVLCNEQFAGEYTRFDEIVFYTFEKIVDRLEQFEQISISVDGGRNLTTRDSDFQKVRNLKNRLCTSLNSLSSIINDEDCDRDQAIHAWGDFFQNDYWNEILQHLVLKSFSRTSSFDNTEEFIEDLFDVNEQYDVQIDCRVSGNGFPLQSITDYLRKTSQWGKFIPHHFKVRCKIGSTTAPSYDTILWKVRNVGSEAERRNDIRGQISDRGREIIENTMFFGPHYIECYLIRNDVCIAIGHVDVPIGTE